MSGMLKGRLKNDLHIRYSAADDSNMEFDPAQRDVTVTQEPAEFDGNSDVNG